jgi:SAM-dependent methyltransferase
MDAPPYSGVRAPISWDFACPICRSVLDQRSDEARCAACDRIYSCSSEIWRFLPEARLSRYDRFLRDYRIVRDDEGWGGRDAAYFLALPEVAADDAQAEIWRRRHESSRVLLATIVEPMAARGGRPLRIADLGAGNGWLTYRLAEVGHIGAAVDLSVDDTDGLGARRWYVPELERRELVPFTSMQAEFDHLPFRDRALDVVLFNASLHYSVDCAVTLREALRVLSPHGTLVIMDSPVYREASSGNEMVREREQSFEDVYGFRSDSLPAEHFLTTSRLEELGRDVRLRWQIHSLVGSRTRATRQWRRLRGQRELAEMPVIAGTRS